MIRKYHIHTLQINPKHREEEPQNTNSHKTSGRQLKQSNQLSLSHQDHCKTREDTKYWHNKTQTKHKTPTSNGRYIKQWFNINRTTITSLEWTVATMFTFSKPKIQVYSDVSQYSKKVSNGAKIRNRYNQVPHLTQDTNGKVTNSQKTPHKWASTRDF